jgi:nucleoid-associated protein YgaU
MGIRAIRYALYGLVVLAAVAIGIGVRFLVQQAAEPIPRSVQTPKQGPGPAKAQDVPRKEEPASPPAADSSGAAAEPQVGTIVPSFDVVRVEPDGQSVIAGRVPPSSEVELLENGHVLDRATANEAGEVVFTPPALGVGNHDLTLRARSADGTVLISKQSVLVRVPQKGQGDLLVVAGEAGKPSKVLQAGPSALSKPAESATAENAAKAEVTKAAAGPQALRIGAVETGDGRLFVQGTGPAGAKLAIYLNDTQLAEATVGADGHWTLTVEKGLAPGDYKVRADQLDADRTVTARAEVPFAYTAEATAPAKTTEAAPETKAPEQQAAKAEAEASPQQQAAQPETAAPESATPGESPSEAAKAEEAEPAPSQEAAAEAPATADEANPVVANIGTVSVKRGDSLWRISRATYGKGIRYTVIYEANENQIRDPDLIYPGQIFVLPSRG